ncbi:MAG: hypothetical protein BWX98_02517 [Candidatus Aminicenantes bacterium ADurb.Bin147]|nr:MAG: hypothetical protein BWX98_02517 [Candidatus Aminicenantes bacterium ADurb.Bin147]
MGPGETELAGFSEYDLLQAGAVQVGEPPRFAAGAVQKMEFRRPDQGVPGVEDVSARQGPVVDHIARGGDQPALSRFRIHGEQGMPALMVGGAVEGLPVGRPGEAVGGAIAAGGIVGPEVQGSFPAGGEVADDNPVTVRLMAGAAHRQVSQAAAVRGEPGLGVGSGIGGDPHRRRRRSFPRGSGRGNHEEIAVGGPGLAAALVLGGEDQSPSVRGQGKFLAASSRRGRTIGVHGGHEILGRPAGQGIVEKVIPFPIAPGVPKTDGQAVEDHS